LAKIFRHWQGKNTGRQVVPQSFVGILTESIKKWKFSKQLFQNSHNQPYNLQHHPQHWRWGNRENIYKFFCKLCKTVSKVLTIFAIKEFHERKFQCFNKALA